MTLAERFEQYTDDDYLEFERIENKRCNRPDLHAFLLLNELQPTPCNSITGYADIISAAEHDEFWIGVDVDKLELTDEQILELVRCGVMYSEEYDGLHMWA